VPAVRRVRGLRRQSADGGSHPPRARFRVCPFRESQKLIWLRMGDPATADPTLVDTTTELTRVTLPGDAGGGWARRAIGAQVGSLRHRRRLRTVTSSIMRRRRGLISAIWGLLS
jgi:hypothetical protein